MAESLEAEICVQAFESLTPAESYFIPALKRYVAQFVCIMYFLVWGFWYISVHHFCVLKYCVEFSLFIFWFLAKGNYNKCTLVAV